MTQTAPQPGNRAAPGGYTDPSMADTQRYWTGEKWSEHRVPRPPATAQASAARSTRPGLWVLRALAVGMAAALLSVWFGMSPETDYEEIRSSIEDNDDANNAMTEGAPQQAVVNGWTANEYLELLSLHQEESDDRRDAMLLLALLGGAVGVGVYTVSRPSADS